VLGLALLGVVLALSCGKKSNPAGPDAPSGPTPNPGGVLLSGAATDNGMAAIVTLPPSPADAADIDGGLFLTRLSGVVSPTATVGDINSALTVHDVRIICMMPGIPFVTLKTARLVDKAALDSLAAALVGSSSFLSVEATYAPGSNLALKVTVAPGGQASQNITHLEAMRMPAAWNVKSLVAVGQKTTVLVADEYSRLNRSSEISAQSFVQGGSVQTRVESDQYIGNHGFHICGILGADFDQAGATGACPDAQTHLSILSLPVGGWTFFDVQAGLVFNVSQHLASGTFLLNTSLGYNDGTFAVFDKLSRAKNMMAWRMLVDGSKHRFLHFTAAGNSGSAGGEGGEARWSSPFASSARFSNMQEMLQGVTLTTAEQATVDAITTFAQQNTPGALAPLQNIVIVGALTSSGEETLFSSTGPDVSAVGSVVYGPCVQVDPGYVPMIPIHCDGQSAQYDGTSQATPQVTGLAAYLLNLRPSLTLTEVRDIVLRSKPDKQEDAYMAVLSLDKTLTGATIRKRLLDVATPTGEGQDGAFDQHDLRLFLQKFLFFETERANSGSDDIDHSRFDLNGNGLTGGQTTSFFDVDVSDPPSFDFSVPQDMDGFQGVFNEHEITDQQILCYYAWSSLYSGNTVQRASLLRACAPPWRIDVLFPATLNPLVGGAGTVQVSRDFGDSLVPESGVQITLTPTGGTATPASGQTGINGRFSTFLDMDDAALQMAVHVVAEYQGHAIGDTTAVLGAVVGNTGTLAFTRRIEKTRSYACSNYGPDCGSQDSPLDTSALQGVLSDSRSWTDAGVWNGFHGSASNVCSRMDTVTVRPDSSLLTIGYRVTSVSSASATSPSADSGGMNASGTGTVELEYQFGVHHAPANLAATVQFNYSDIGADSCCKISDYLYALQVFRVGEVTPMFDFIFFTPTPVIPVKDLGVVLSTGDYRMKLTIQAGAAANAEGSTATLNTDLIATGHITIGTAPLAP